MKPIEIAVIGGGAAGMTAAISAASEGAKVTIYERNDRLGKKILATGNGKCNLGNLKLSGKDYYSGNPELVKKCLEQFGPAETKAFFEQLGLMLRDKNGYLYPYGEQASAVLDVLRYAVEQHGVTVIYEAKINRLRKCSDCRIEVGYEGGQAYCYDRVIIACGSKAAPKTGSDGSGYKLAKQLGLSVTEIYPALVQLKCEEDACKAIAGVRAEAGVHIMAGGKEVLYEEGEVQFTDYGISGIPVFQLSGSVNRMLRKEKRLEARIDFFPEESDEAWKEKYRNRFALFQEKKGTGCEATIEAFFTGMLNKKIMTLLVKNAGLKMNTPLSAANIKQLEEVWKSCRALVFHINGSNSYDSAQVCTGGVDLHQLTPSLEAKSMKGLYFAGEVLDVDGRCGGYNLHWAWCSGYLAGKAAGRRGKQ